MNGSGDPSRRGRRRQGESLGESLDQWVAAGRQLVDGVAGARPGSRPQSRTAGGRSGERPSLEGLGRWMENRLDWFTEEEDDWPEPWQRRAESAPPPPQASGTRRPLEAISRRSAPLLPPARPAADEWPDDDTFTRPRWQRRDAEPQPPQQQESSPPRRPLPRSSRRRS